METWMALFQETVGKLSPPMIEVNLTQEEEDGGVGELIKQLILESTSCTAARDSVSSPSVEGG